MSSTCTTAAQVPSIPIQPGAWRDTRWVGSVAGRATSPELLAGSCIVADHQHAITRIYAAACADLAQATLGGAAPRTANWDRWFDALRSAARELSPARGNQQVVQRALFHGARLEAVECGACGLASTPAICAECPNLHLLQAVLRRPACAPA